MILLCLLFGHRWRLLMRYSWARGYALPVCERCSTCGARRDWTVHDFARAR